MKLVIAKGRVVAKHSDNQDITIEKYYPKADEVCIVPDGTPLTGEFGDPMSSDPTPDPRPGLDPATVAACEVKGRAIKFKKIAVLKTAIEEAVAENDTDAQAELQKELDVLRNLTAVEKIK